MKISLSSVHFSERMSQDSNCFDAIVNIDGKPAFQVKNDGWGGDNIYSQLNGQSLEDWRAKYESVKRYASSLPEEKHPTQNFTYQPSICTLVEDALDHHMQIKKLKSILNRMTVFKTPDRLLCIKKKFEPGIRARTAVNYPGCVFLHEIPIDDALKIYQEGTK